MIRLTVITEQPAGWQEIGPRIRGATLGLFDAAVQGREPPADCDAVVMTQTGHGGGRFVEASLSAGKHVLLATEPWWSWDDLAAWLAAARRMGVQLAVVNPDHYLPSRQVIREQRGAHLGTAGLVRVHRWEPADARAVEGVAGLPGPLIRDLELALDLFGGSPDLVYAVEQRAADGGPAGRLLQVHLGFPDGGMALIGYAGGLPAGDGYQTLSVIGFAGAAYADDHQNVQLLYRGGHPQALKTGETAPQRAALVQEFVDAVASGRDLAAGVAGWRAVLAVADAAGRSLASGRAVPLEGR